MKLYNEIFKFKEDVIILIIKTYFNEWICRYERYKQPLLELIKY